MWWSPDSRKLAYYRFDEKPVLDFYLQMNQTEVQDTLDVEAYPKPGKPNPVVDLFVYDVAAKKTGPGRRPRRQAVRQRTSSATTSTTSRGRRTAASCWCNRTNRQQNILELAACSPDTGKCRAVVHEEWPTGWIENRPEMRFLKDGKRFIWESQRNGWKNFYLYDLSGTLDRAADEPARPTKPATSCWSTKHANRLFYTARDGDNFMKLQLHRVGLDGSERQAADRPEPSTAHVLPPRPTARYFVDVAQTHDTPPATRLLDADGKVVAELAKSDTSKFDAARPEEGRDVHVPAADGKTRAARPDSVPVELRSVAEVSGAG